MKPLRACHEKTCNLLHSLQSPNRVTVDNGFRAKLEQIQTIRSGVFVACSLNAAKQQKETISQPVDGD